MSYGFTFWRNSTDSKRVFNIQNKVIRILALLKDMDMNITDTK
jgi:hypothetical protein